MKAATSHDQHAHRILLEIDAGRRVSQRSLANDLGIALGLTNLVVRRLVRKGWVRIIRMKPNSVRYLLTPAGMAAKARMSRAALQNSIRFYVQARNRIRDRFEELSRELQDNGQGAATGADSKRIVFYGAGEVAEIGYICLHGTDLKLIGVIDPVRKEDFFNVPVCNPSRLRATRIDGKPFNRLVVMSFEKTGDISALLEALGISPERVFWI